MSYWIFKCNPDKFSLRERLENREARTTWQVNRYKYKIMKRDIAFIWRTTRDIGIVAVMRVDSYPYNFEELPLEKEYYKRIGNEEPDIGKRCRVEGIFLGRCRLIRLSEIRKNKSLENISALKDQMGTNFELTEQQGKILMSLFEKRRDEMVYKLGSNIYHR